MRTLTDAVRSLHYYCHLALGDEWEVRIAEEADAFAAHGRPFALVGPSGPLLGEAAAAVHADLILPCSVHLWTEQGSDPEDALLLAMAAEQRLGDAVYVGVGVGGPERVPLWDFDGVGADEWPTLRGLSDYMRVRDFTTTRQRDPDDATLYEVVADVRLGWRRRGRVPSGTERAKSVLTRVTEAT